MKMILGNSKKAAMEMSVGTIVTIVLLMTVLILGLVMVRTIFKGSIENINGIDKAVKDQINKLFSEDTSRQIVVYPSSRYITIKKGEDNLGFGFSIRNVGEDEDSFTYDVSAVEAQCTSLKTNLAAADKFITLGKTRALPGIKLSPGSFMDDPVFVRFTIPQTAPPCKIRYSVEVSHSEGVYATIDVDLEIKSA
jgi:hypothetical protein